MRSFTKIKHSHAKGETTVSWSDTTLKGTVESTLKAGESQPPAPAFLRALDAFVPEVCELLELPPRYRERMRCQGVSLSTSDSGARGLVVTCLKEIGGANGPVVLNTPHLPLEAGDEVAPTVPPAMVRLLDELETAAEAFVQGEREQRDLFAGAGGPRV